jgi:hypothetical protein
MNEDDLNTCPCCRGICDCEYSCEHPHNDYLFEQIERDFKENEE